MKKVVPLLAASSLSILLTACTWVKVTPAAEGVRVASAEEVSGCKQVGTASANVLSKVGFVARNEYKVAAELEALARDQAAKLGGNVIVADTEVVEGQQSFRVYMCS